MQREEEGEGGEEEEEESSPGWGSSLCCVAKGCPRPQWPLYCPLSRTLTVSDSLRAGSWAASALILVLQVSACSACFQGGCPNSPSWLSHSFLPQRGRSHLPSSSTRPSLFSQSRESTATSLPVTLGPLSWPFCSPLRSGTSWRFPLSF